MERDYERIRKFGEFLNTLGYEIEFDEDGFWFEDYFGDEHKIKDVAELCFEFIEYENKLNN